MSLYSDDSASSAGLTKFHFDWKKLFFHFDWKKFFQIGFLFLAISQAARFVEWLVHLGLHWSESGKPWSIEDWFNAAIYLILTVAFVFLVFRYLRQSNNKLAVWILLTYTGIAWISHLIWCVLTFVHTDAFAAFSSIDYWVSLLGSTGKPLGAIVIPFMKDSESAWRAYNLYASNTDFIIRLLFFGLSLAKYPEEPRPVPRPMTLLGASVRTESYPKVTRATPRLVIVAACLLPCGVGAFAGRSYIIESSAAQYLLARVYLCGAKVGIARAENNLGVMYENGEGGLTQDDSQAVYWYRRAAEQEFARAQNDLGAMYESGRGGLTKDDAQAVSWYRKAAEQGFARAQTNLGFMYESGRGGLTKDDAQTVSWYRKAAEQGDANGQTNLGVMYANGRGGLTKDDTQAASWYRKGAEQGFAPAQTNLGVMYQNGRGLTKDDTQAVSWYRKAAEQGDVRAQTNLGYMYTNGLGGLPQDDTQAVAWYRKAAEGGDAVGQTNLGVMYERGEGGLAKDATQAASWYRKAAEQGEPNAQTGLGLMYANGLGGLPKDDAQAVSWYRKAAEQGFAPAQSLLKSETSDPTPVPGR